MAAKSQHFFNPCDAPNAQRLPAKIWELLRRNDSFRRDVNRLRALDKRATKETKEYQEVARQYNQAVADQDNAQIAASWQRLDQIKHRPTRSETLRLIEKHQRTHPLAALALTWLVPEPEFFIRCKCRSRVQEGHGFSPDWSDWSWRNVYVGSGRKLAVKVGGESWTRGPGIFASTLTNPFPDWQNWRPGQALFDYKTPWNRLPRSFRRQFVAAWRDNYDSPDAHEFNFLRQPRKTDRLSRADFANYLSFRQTVKRNRLFAVSPAVLTTKDVGSVFGKLVTKLKRRLPESREHLFGSEAAWGHYLALREIKLSLAEHLAGPDYKAKNSAEVTERVRNQRKNVQFGVKSVEKLIALVYPAFDLKKTVLVHSAPPRKNRRKS
jgi:hypothetical protein